MPKRVAIIGAGISGLCCAARLREAGYHVRVFEKARGPGGRMPTRRLDTMRFDHGAQYFTASDSDFSIVVKAWHEAGIVAPWEARFGSWSPEGWCAFDSDRISWVGTPSMSAIGRHLAQGLTVQLQTRVVEVRRSSGGWHLKAEGENELGVFDLVLVTCPGPQAAELLPVESQCHGIATRLSYGPCWAAMFVFEQPVATDYDAFQLEHPVLRWAARDSSKPGREPGERWVIHAGSKWSATHLEREPGQVKEMLVESFHELTGSRPDTVQLHRWRYALADEAEHGRSLFEDALGLGVCGDGIGGPRVENAWLSGMELAETIIATRRGVL